MDNAQVAQARIEHTFSVHAHVGKQTPCTSVRRLQYVRPALTAARRRRQYPGIARQQLTSGVRTQRHEFAGLNYRRMVDFNAWTESLEIDGGIRYQWQQPAAAGCHSGGYLFDTRTPLVRNLDLERFDSGELVINRTVNARLFSAENVPAGLPVPANGMLAHVEVKNVGSFDYDTDSLWLGSVAQCP